MVERRHAERDRLWRVLTSSRVSCRVRSRIHPFSGTIGDVGEMGRRLAGTLARHGIKAGDVVAFQLPNWVEAVACFYGLLSIGVVVVPIVHIYGSKETGHILRQSRARVLITADRFGRQDYLANLEAGLPELPDLEMVVVVSAAGAAAPRLGTTVLSWSQALDGADPLDRPPRVDPDSPALIGYTSGTTAAPKGVIHTHRTYLADQRTWATFLGEEKSPPPSVTPTASLTASPVGHIMGLASVLRPLFSASPLDLMDVWEPGAVLDAMASDGVATGGGPPYFLLSLINHPDFDPAVHLPYMDRLVMGGAPVPIAVVQARDGSGHLAHPSLRIHRAPLHHRVIAIGPPRKEDPYRRAGHLRIRDRVVRRRRRRGTRGRARGDPFPRTRALRGLHRPGADCGGDRSVRVVRHGRHRRPR